MTADLFPVVPLGELCDPARGITYGIVKVGDFVPGGVPVIRGGDIRNGRVAFDDEKRVSQEVSHQFERTILRGGEIVINLIAEPGHTAIVPSSLRGANVSRDVGVIPLGESVDHRYVDYCLKAPSSVEWLTFRLQGSVTQKINLGTLRELPIPLPAVREQGAIARILGALDDKIELNRRTNETLEAMARAIFQSWFVDFDPVRAKMVGRQPAGMDAETEKLFPATLATPAATGAILPQGWAVTSLGDLVSVLETGSRPKGGVGAIDIGIPSIGAESIVGLARFDFSKTKYVSNEFFEGMPRGKVVSRDVLIYKDGGRPGEFRPHVSMFGDGFPFARCAINEHVYRVRGIDGVPQTWLFFALSHDERLEEMHQKGSGVAVPGLNSTAARSLQLVNPGPALLARFHRAVDPMVSRCLRNSSQSRALANLRDALLPKLLSGELRVPDAERAVSAVL